jgi:hypothetical protein
LSEHRIEVLVDPGPLRAPAQALFAADGEFAVAWRGLRGRGVVLPFDVVVHLYAYEFLERLRECTGASLATAVQAPFWPEAMFVAGDVHAHAGDELAALRPALDVTWRPPRVDDVAAGAQALFACLPFDPAVYTEELAAWAARAGWRSR